eukprot:m.95137 g.95137  ORF g.95137 m.95137 type:complete len:523 (-) comp8939_c1_seq1:4683-6251(-)
MDTLTQSDAVVATSPLKKGTTDADIARDAKRWLAETGLVSDVEAALNLAFERQPKDCFGFMSRRMEMKALPPSVVKLVAHQTLDSKLEDAVAVEVILLDRLLEISHATVFTNIKMNDGGVDDITSFFDTVTKAFEGRHLVSVNDSEEILEHFGEEQGKSLLQAASLSVATALANKTHTFFAHAFLPFSIQPQHVSFPTPLVKIFSPASCSGKLHIRGVYVRCPRQMPAIEQAKVLKKLHKGIEDALHAQKSFSSHATIDPISGCYDVPFDKLSQVMDVFRHACERSELVCGHDAFLTLDIGAEREGMFEPSKGKYELEGAGIKVADWINVLKDLCEDRKNGIADIIDPLITAASDSWKRLQEYAGNAINIGTQMSEQVIDVAIIEKEENGQVSNGDNNDVEEDEEEGIEPAPQEEYQRYNLKFACVSNENTIKSIIHTAEEELASFNHVIVDGLGSVVSEHPSIVDISAVSGASYFTTTFPLNVSIMQRLSLIEKDCQNAGIHVVKGYDELFQEEEDNSTDK